MSLPPPPLTLSNAGFSDYEVSLTPNGRPLKVGVFSKQTIPHAALAKANYTVYVTLADNVQHKVVFDPTTGVVTQPAWLNKAVMPGSKQAGGVTKQVLRASPNTPFALRSWTLTLGSPWFCVAGSVGVVLLVAAIVGAVLLGKCLSSKKDL
jgi:hypothetical protein